MKFNTIVSLSLLALGQSTHVEDEYKPAILDGIEYQELVTPFVKSENDDRKHLGLKLSNQMKVLLVSDPTADKAAASVDVMAGSMLNPVEMPGRAHFCEHLFAGSKKYPGVNDYEGYLANHACGFNACTSYGNTNYFFEAGFEFLEGALDIFAHTFIDPLFSEDRVKKEANAVNSEFFKDKPLDAYIIDQVQRSFSNSSHPYAKFSGGNYSTLYDWQIENGKKPEIEVRAYFEKYYSANLMSLVVIGRESLDDLARMVIPKFSKLKNTNIPQPSIKGYPIPTKHLGTELTIIPMVDYQYLEMQFYLPSMIGHIEENPLKFIETLINARGSGSLTDQLEEKGWITDLSSGSDYYLDFSVFTITFQLTHKGIPLRYKIISLAFEYIELIKKKAMTTSRFVEFSSISKLHYNYKEKDSNMHYASFLASTINQVPSFSSGYSDWFLTKSLNNEFIMDTLKLSTKEKLIVTSIYNSNNTNQIEPWFGTEYAVSKIDQRLTVPTGMELSLPKPNPLVPEKFEIVNVTSQVLLNDSAVMLWQLENSERIP